MKQINTMMTMTSTLMNKTKASTLMNKGLMRKVTTLVVGLLVTSRLFASWIPSEKYANWIPTFQVDKTWKFENGSHGEGVGGSVHSGTSTVAFPGTIAWCFMSWDERCHDSDDHNMQWFELYLRNGNNDNDMIQIVGIYISGGDNDYWPTTINNYNGNVTSYSQARWYNYADGSWFCYMVTTYSDVTRKFIERAGSNLQVRIRTRWDDNSWNTYTKATPVDYSDRQFLSVPSAPSVNDVSWTIHDNKTSVKYTRTISSGCQFRLRSLYNGSQVFDAVSQNTNTTVTEYTYPFQQNNKPTSSEMYQTPLTYECYSEKVYTMNQAYYLNYFSTAPSTSVLTSAKTTFSAPPFAQVQDFAAKDNNDGNVRLTWTMQACSGSSYDKSDFVIERSTDKNFTQDVTQIFETYYSTQTSYKVDQAFSTREKGKQTYYYRIYRKNAAHDNNVLTQTKSVNVNTDYAKITSLTGEINSNNHPVLHWNISNGVCTEQMKLRLSFADMERSMSLSDAIKQNTLEIDEALQACKPISYKAQIVENSTIHQGEQQILLTIPNNMRGIIQSYSMSKGFYNDRVQLRWKIDPNQYNFAYFQVSRKEVGTDTQDVILGTIDFKNGVLDYAFEDVNCVPGAYYQYHIIGYTSCDDESHPIYEVSSIGFAQPYGVVSGQITYSGNQGVPDVAVSVIGETAFRSRALRFIGKNHSRLDVPQSFLQSMVEKEGTIEFFLRDENAYTSTVHTIARFGDSGVRQMLQCQNNALFLSMKATLNSTDTICHISNNKFYHIAMAYNKDHFNIYVNGELFYSNPTPPQEGSRWFDKNIVFGGDDFDGFIDEIRIWNICRSQAEIQRTMNIYLNGSENGLTGYYRCDDETENELFDISRTGTTFNEHHLPMVSITPDPDNIPTNEQLSLKTYTDKDGNYLINNIPFTVDGSLYKVIPTLGVHEFSPSSRPLFFSRDASTHNSIDFTDKSSFEVTGKVTFENTDYPVKGCQFYVDGLVCTTDGKVIESDAEGNFNIQVPIGEHSLSIKKDGHTFVNEGRYPADPSGAGLKALFDAPRTNMQFYDNTTVLVVGRVAGGEDEENKKHGFGLGTANIGQAQIVLTPPEDIYNLNLSTTDSRIFDCPDSVLCNSIATTKKVNGEDAHYVTILTDPQTGEFAVALPPIDFEISKIGLVNNSDILFDKGKYENLTLGSSNIHQTSTDTLYIDSVNYKTLTYLQKLDVIHYALPELSIEQWGNQFGALGEQTYYITLPSGLIDTIPIFEIGEQGPIYTMGTPAYLQDKAYSWTISAYETYVNYDDPDNPITVHQPMRNAIVTIENELGDKEVAQEDGYVVDEKGDSAQVVAGQIISLNQNQVLLDSLGTAKYIFVVGEPNIVSPYTYNVNITYETADHSRVYPWSENGKCKGLIFGSRTSGSNFVTDGPDQLLFVLRDPPGGQSFATWEKGESIITTTETTHEQNRGTEFEHLFHGGLDVKTGSGIGVIVFTEIENQNNAGFGTQYDGLSRWSTSRSYEITTSQTISTKPDYPFVGTKGDVFVGAGTNRIFGNARKVTLERVSDNPAQYEIVVRDVIATGSTFKTSFAYSTMEIEGDVIPNYIKQRNALLQRVDKASYNLNYPNYTSEAIYITTLSPDDPRFGSNNYDTKIWGSAATPIDSLGGPSYIMIPPAVIADTVQGILDKICHFNNQIHRWQDVLAANEECKVTVHHSSQKFDYDLWDSAGKKVAEALNWRTKMRDPSATACRAVGEDQILCLREFLEDDFTNSGVDTSYTNVRDYYNGGWLLENYSLGGGASITSSRTETSGSSDGFHEEDGCKLLFKGETTAKINTIGFTIKNTTYAGYNHTYNENTEKVKKSAVSYTLSTNSYEYMSIDVYASPDGFGPIFSTRGGQTYCPYEGEERTKYFEPGEHELHTATVNMEEPQITVEQPTITDVPIGGKAIYTLTLANTADVAPDYFTWLKLYTAGDHNPLGAQISVDGSPLTDAGRLIKFFPSTPIIKTLTLAQTDLGVLDYDSIAIILTSDCSSYQQADTVWLSAHFVPTCSPINLRIDNTTINTSTGDTLPITITGYDRNFRNFKSIRLQYRHSSENDWHLIREFCANESDTVGGLKTLITGPSIYYSLAMPDTQFPDGQYEFRAVTACTFGNDEIPNESEIIAVMKDMQRPVALGLPSPINGIYTSDNQIYVDFNEPILSGRVRDKNISVKGVLNSQPVGDHAVALQLKGDYLVCEADYNFNNTDFTIEFWYNYTHEGLIMAHARGTDIGIILGISNKRLVADIGNFECRSRDTIPQNKWCYITINYEANAFDNEHGALTAHYAIDDQEVLLLDHVSIPKYDMRGNLLIGGLSECKMHDFAIWNTLRDWRTSLSERNKRKDSYTDGLISYWPMDDGEGMIAHDIIRNRHLQLPSDNVWWYNNNNIALTIPQGEVAKMPLAECPIPAGEDYVFECWFRMKQDGTLFYLSDSTMAVGFSGNRLQLTLKNGIWEVPTPVTPTDGIWHHLALNYRHNTLPIFLLDGHLLDVVGVDELPAFASAYLIFSSEQATAEVDIDEVRLWNAYIMPQNILLNRRNELRGNESGLVAYYPMEQDTTDEAMQPVKLLSLNDRISSHAITLAHPTPSTIVPALRKSRPVEAVKHTYTPSAQRLVINVTESAARIEGCTLEFEVTDIVDEHGNYSSPILWTAFVNRNQLLWAEDAIRITKTALKDTTLTLTIENNSGKVENWFINNVPLWLTLSETGGILQPLQKKQISATIHGSLDIGNHEHTLYLTGNQAVMTPLRLTVRVNANKPDWAIRPADYEFSMNMIATASVNSFFADDSEDLVAAFIGNELAGLASPQLISAYNRHYIMMNIYANLTQAEKDSINHGLTLAKRITFKYWDASTGRIYTDVRVTLPGSNALASDTLYFTGGKLEGTLTSPVRLSAGKSAEQTIPLDKGWNWVSFNVMPKDVHFNAVLTDMMEKITIIKSQDEYAQVSTIRDSLQGSLKVMDCIKGYKLHVSTPYLKTVTGSVINPLFFSINLAGKQHWTWMGYLPQMSLDVNTALANINPNKGDIIKSRIDFAVWDGYQWVGSLKVMSPGNAYLYCNIGTDDISFTYPSLTGTTAPARQTAMTAQTSAFPTPVPAGLYAGNMTLTAVVRDGEQLVTDAEVAIFAGEECRTVATQEDGLWFITIPGETTTPLSIKVATGERIITANQSLTYVEDAVVGTCDEPYVIQIGVQTDHVPTAVQEGAQKVISNGILYIKRNGHYYNAQGALIKQ